MRRTLFIALTALALLLVGCGTSGGDDATSGSKDDTQTEDFGSTTAPEDPDDDTTAPDEDEAEPPADVTSAQLEAILPTAEDIGPEYSLKESEDEDEGDDTTTTEPGEEDPTDAALKEQCPKAAELDFLEDDEDNDDEVTVEFETELDQGIEVSLDPTLDSMTEENMAKVIEAFNDCGTVTIEDPDAGSMSMDLSAKELDDYGDYGAEITMTAEFDLFGQAISIEFNGYIFAVNGVGVSVTASSGLDPNTFEPTPADVDLLPTLSAEMEQRVKSITE